MSEYYEDKKVNIKNILIGSSLILIILGLVYFKIRLESRRNLDSNVFFMHSEESTVNSQTSIENETSTSNMIYVDIKGEVVHPGVYPLEYGARVFDLVDQAGGFTSEADQKQLNLALLLADQSMVQVPKIGELTKVENDGKAKFETSELVQGPELEEEKIQSDLVNINIADQATLESLPNIGPKKAQDIIQYRESHGSFQTIEEIEQVTGIGPKTFEALKDFISVGP